MKKYIPHKWKAKESWGSILIPDKVDLKINNITRDKEGHYVMIKGSIQQDDITIVNIIGCISTQLRSTSIHETNTIRPKKRN